MLKLQDCLRSEMFWNYLAKRCFSVTCHRYRNRWTASEIGMVKDLLQQQKSSWEIASHFPNHSTSSVDTKASKLRKTMNGVRICKYARWTDAEKKIVREAKSKGLGLTSVAALLPGRSYESIVSCQRRMREEPAARQGHMKISEQEGEDIVRMRDDENLAWSEIANRTGRTRAATMVYYRNRVKWSTAKGPSFKPWPEEEVTKLRNLLAAGMPREEIAKLMDRSIQSIANQIFRLTRLEDSRYLKYRVVPFSHDEDRLLVEGKLAGKRPQDLSDLLPSRSISAVRRRLKRLEDQPKSGNEMSNSQREPKRWTAEQEARVIKAREDGVSWRNLAMELGRSEDSIRVKHVRLRQSVHLRKDEDSSNASTKS